MLDGIRTLEGPRYALKMHLRPFKKYKTLIFNRLSVIRTRVQLPPAPPKSLAAIPESTAEVESPQGVSLAGFFVGFFIDIFINQQPKS